MINSATKQSILPARMYGLLRFARNDVERFLDRHNEKRAESARSLLNLVETLAALLRRLLVHGAGRRHLATDRLDRTFDRSPQPADLGCGTAFRVIFAGAFALTERQQQIGAVGDLTAPHRRAEFCQSLARDGDDTAFD